MDALDGTHITRINGETNLATVVDKRLRELSRISDACLHFNDRFIANAMIIPIFVAASGTCISLSSIDEPNHIVLLKN